MDPSLIPIIVVIGLPLLFVAHKIYQGISSSSSSSAQKPKQFGRGAEGFMTGSKKIGIPPEIAARIRAGEEVSGEEITAALDKIRQDQEDAERELIEEEARRVKAEEKAANKRGGNQTRRRVQK